MRTLLVVKPANTVLTDRHERLQAVSQRDVALVQLGLHLLVASASVQNVASWWAISAVPTLFNGIQLLIWVDDSVGAQRALSTC